MAEAINILKQQGAIIVDPSDIPSVVHKAAAGLHHDLFADRWADRQPDREERQHCYSEYDDFDDHHPGGAHLRDSLDPGSAAGPESNPIRGHA
jgi:hypothetical protein